jgi:hypothetical protein
VAVYTKYLVNTTYMSKKKVTDKKTVKKKKAITETPKSIKLDFTGTMVIILETTEWGPMEFRYAGNRDLVLDVISVLLKDKSMGTVESQTTLETSVCSGLLAEANEM